MSVFGAGVAYVWAIGDAGRNSSFICEIALQDSYKIVEKRRDFGGWLDRSVLDVLWPVSRERVIHITFISGQNQMYCDQK